MTNASTVQTIKTRYPNGKFARYQPVQQTIQCSSCQVTIPFHKVKLNSKKALCCPYCNTHLRLSTRRKDPAKPKANVNERYKIILAEITEYWGTTPWPQLLTFKNAPNAANPTIWTLAEKRICDSTAGNAPIEKAKPKLAKQDKLKLNAESTATYAMTKFILRWKDAHAALYAVIK